MKPTNRRPPSNIKQSVKQEPPRRFTSTQKSSNNIIKQTSKPSTYIPKYKKQVDVLSYANNIIQKANSTDDVKQKIVKDQMGDSLQLKQKQPTKNIHYTQQQKQLPKFQKETSFTKHQEGTYQIPKPQKKTSITKKQKDEEVVQNSRSQLLQIASRYQTMQKQLLLKVDALQQQLYQMKQADKKNANIVKQHKNCSKQIKKLTECIKQHEIQFNRYVSDSNVPYSNKREVILQSHIQKLKQYNKQLTVRLKAYKGTEIQSKANPAVKVYVLNDYQKDKQIDYSLQKLEFQSLAFRINKQLQGYLSKKIKKNLSFTQQQRHITDLINLLNQFGFECLLQGLRVQNGQIDVENLNVNFQQRVNNQKQYPPINDQYNKIVKHSIFNLSVINQTKQVIQNIKPLISKLSKPSTTIFDCFRSSKKLPQIQSKLQQTLGAQIRMIKNTNNVLLSVLATTLGRYDIMKNYVDNLIRDIRRKLKEISTPLDDLNNLYEYKDKRQDIFKQKLSVFVSSNIQKMCLKIPELQKQMQEVPIRFSKLVNFI